jgi:hypothetical protein
MVKTLLNADELEQVILSELRALPSCAGVDQVTVVKETKIYDANWRVAHYGRPWHDLSPDFFRQSITIQNHLRHRYDVAWPDNDSTG